MSITYADRMQAHIREFETPWREFLASLARSSALDSRVGDRWERECIRHLDSIAASFIAWNAQGVLINDLGLMDDARLLELIEPCVPSVSDRNLFLTICKHETRVIRALSIAQEEEDAD